MMSEKRFIEDFSYLVNYSKHHCILDRIQEKNLELDEIISLLNNLYQENEQLRILLKERQYEKDISKCREENIKLQQVLSENEKILGKDLDMLTELRRENGKLRQELDNLQKSINYWQNLYKETIDKIPPKVKEVWIE